MRSCPATATSGAYGLAASAVIGCGRAGSGRATGARDCGIAVLGVVVDEEFARLARHLALDAGEEADEGVIIVLRPAIEGVIVALRTLNADAGEQLGYV